MLTTNNALIDDLIERTRSHLNALEQLRSLPEEVLQHKTDADSWNALECIEHLNLYGDFYLPEIEKSLKKANIYPAEGTFKSGWLGNYFAKSLLPKEKLNKMKTFRDKDPNGLPLDKSVLSRFLQQQKQTLDLLNRARTVNMTQVRVPTTIARWIRINLGDIFRVVIYHNQRHILQAQRVIAHLQKQEA
ncbi:MAG: DinB family protein [Bacteroidota bacterium]